MLLLESLIFQESPESISYLLNNLEQDEKTVHALNPASPDIIVKGKAAKRLFARLADRKFLDSLVTSHWTYSLGNLIQLLKSPPNSEISCNVTRERIPSNGRFGLYGVVVKGHITFLANDMDDVYSGTYKGYWADNGEMPYFFDSVVTDKESEKWYKNFLKQRQRTSGVNKGFQGTLRSVVLDEEDFRENVNNEALVDNWKPLAIIVPLPAEQEKIREFTKTFVGSSDEVREYLKSR